VCLRRGEPARIVSTARCVAPRGAPRLDAAAPFVLVQSLAGFRVDDFFPEAADLPENIPAAELEARYGGVEGRLFRQYAAEVERRLWSCPAYRALAPTAETK
jgi:hypothetical protein